MERILLCSLNILALAILLGLFFDIKFRHFHNSRKLKNVVVHCAIFSFAELAYNLTYGKAELIPFQHLANIVYYIELVAVPCSWLFFVTGGIVTKIEPLTFSRVLFIYLPILIVGIACGISPFTGFVYSIDNSGIFRNGPFAEYVSFVSVVFYLAAVTRSLVLASRERDPDLWVTYYIINAFCAIPMLCAALQLYTGVGGVLSAGEAVAVFYVCTRIKNHQISLDPLTGLNNRSQLNYYVRQRSSVGICAFNNSWIVMADIDKFKKINDTFGHLEGDFALASIGRILKDAATRFDCFASRYGGDEFVIIIHGDEKRVRSLCDYVEKNVVRSEYGSRYKLTLSMGIARIPDFSQDDIETLMHQADKNMYSVKQSKSLLQV